MIETIVFDVGRVLIDFGYERFFAWLNGHGAGIRDVEHFSDRVGLAAYERGEFDDAGFLQRLAALLGRPVSRAELTSRWNDLFSPVVPMLQLAEGLKAHYGVYLLSNISGLHWDHLWRQYELGRVSHGGAASCQLGACKPEARAFDGCCRRFGLRPEATVFIDDTAANVEGAVACGWHGIHHCTPHATRERLRLLGVRLPPPPLEWA